MKQQMKVALAIPFALALAGPANSPLQAVQSETGGPAGVYSFVGALEGSASLFAARSGARSELELHLPVLRGDRIWTGTRARLAVLMSDRSLLALDRDSEVTLERINGSPDAEDENSLYLLHRGRLGLEVSDHLLQSELPVVDTANVRIHVKRAGNYQVDGDGSGWTEVTVFAGFAEVVTRRGSVIVRSGETMVADGLDNPDIRFQDGAGVTAAALADWTRSHRDRLAAYTAVDADGYRDALASHGEWVEVEDRRAWRPAVAASWQPYSRGRWSDTPAGLYWVARDPWGPLTYHYGTWNRHPRWGWLWFPGRVYAPSHVYWYWGPSYVGWIPRGYYQHYYRGLGLGLRFGLYGWAGGLWDPFDTWVFCPTGRLGYGRGYSSGRSLRHRHPRLERGIITTDTRGIGRRNWHDPALTRRALVGGRAGLNESSIPNADNFVARVPDLDPSFRREITRGDVDPVVKAVRRVSRSGRRWNGGDAAGAVQAVPADRPGRAAASPKDDGDLRRVRRLSPTPAVRADAAEEPKEPIRKAAPAHPEAGSSPGRRPTPARRVLDVIRGRNGSSAPVQVRSVPRPATPKAAPPDRVRSTPRPAAPRAAPPGRVRSTPRTVTPRAAPPGRVRATPQPATPKAAPPGRVRSTPRTVTPKAAPPGRVRATPRPSRPKAAPPGRVRSTPQPATPKAAPPSRVRSTPRRTSAPSDEGRRPPSFLP